MYVKRSRPSIVEKGQHVEDRAAAEEADGGRRGAGGG